MDAGSIAESDDNCCADACANRGSNCGSNRASNRCSDFDLDSSANFESNCYGGADRCADIDTRSAAIAQSLAQSVPNSDTRRMCSGA